MRSKLIRPIATAVILMAAYPLALVYTIGWFARFSPWSYAGRSDLEAMLLMSIPHLIAVAAVAFPMAALATLLAPTQARIACFVASIPVAIHTGWSLASVEFSGAIDPVRLVNAVKDCLVLLFTPLLACLAFQRWAPHPLSSTHEA